MATETIRIIINEFGSRQTAQSVASIGAAAHSSNGPLITLQRLLAGMGVLWLIKQYNELSSTWTTYGNRIAFVTTSLKQQQAVQKELLNVANETRTAFEDTAELYARVALNSRNLNTTQKEVIRMTKTLNEAFILSGATEREATAAMIQFTQGLAMGSLKGFELRSVLQETRYLADMIAKQMGVDTEALKKLGAEGKITSQIILEALRNGAAETDAAFARMPISVKQSFTILRNMILATVGEMDARTGLGSGIANGIRSIALQWLPTLSLELSRLFQQLRPMGPWLVNIIRSIGAGILFVVRALTTGVTYLNENNDALKKLQLTAMGLATVMGTIWAAHGLYSMTTALRAMNMSLTAATATSGRLLFTLLAIASVAEGADWVGKKAKSAGVSSAIETGYMKSFDWSSRLARMGLEKTGMITPGGAVANYMRMYSDVYSSEMDQKNKLGAMGQVSGIGQASFFEVIGDSMLRVVETKFMPAMKKLDAAMAAGLPAGPDGKALEGKLPYTPGKSPSEVIFEEKQRLMDEQQIMLQMKSEGIGETQIKQYEEQLRLTQELAKADAPVTLHFRSQLEYQMNALVLQKARVELQEKDRDFTRTLQDQNQLMSFGTQQREVEAAILPTINAYKKAGLEIDAQQLEQMRELLTLNQQLRQMEEVRTTILGDQQKIADEVAAARALYAKGEIDATQLQRFEWQKSNEALQNTNTALSGIQQAMNDLALQSTDTAGQMKTVFSNAFQGMEDAFVQFVQTGQLSFTNLINSMIADIARMMWRQTMGQMMSNLIGGAIGGLMPNGSGYSPSSNWAMETNATGGPVSAGVPSIVGEHGPEIFIPSQSGRIDPNTAHGVAGRAVNVTVVNVSDPKEVPAALNTSEGQSAIINVIRRNRAAVRSVLNS